MATVRGTELESKLEAAAQMPVCALVGSDEALRSRCLAMLRRAAAPPEMPGSTVRTFEDLPQARDVFDELRTVPFMGLAGRRVVVVEKGDAFLRGSSDRLVAYLKRPARTGMLILVLSTLDGRSAAAKAIASAGLVVDCRPLSWREAEGWLRAEAGRMGRKLTPRAAAAMMEAVGPNLSALKNELEKLAAYGEGRATLTERDVGEIVSSGRSRSAYELGNAVAAGQAAEALRLCEQLLMRGESVGAILSVLARQVRQFWQLQRLAAEGLSENDMARRIGLPPFAVRRGLKAARRLQERWFAERLRMLAEADLEAKTTAMRSGEERPWLEELIVRLADGSRSGAAGR